MSSMDSEIQNLAHRPAITGHCDRMLGSFFDAEDATQEALLRAWKGLEQFDGRASVKNWLYSIATNVCLRPIGKALNRGAGAVDADITYLFRITARTEQEAHMRALLLHSIGGQPLLLKSLKSDDVEHTDKVEVQAVLTSTGRQNVLLEQIVSRLSLEPGVSGVSWEILAEQE